MNAKMNMVVESKSIQITADCILVDGCFADGFFASKILFVTL